jgi:hypothetical protein
VHNILQVQQLFEVVDDKYILFQFCKMHQKYMEDKAEYKITDMWVTHFFLKFYLLYDVLFKHYAYIYISVYTMCMQGYNHILNIYA